jgi:nucleotide-binding universal stress UspA family protein
MSGELRTSIGAGADGAARARPDHGAVERKGANAMKKIMIAVDGSPASTEALEFGLDLAAEEAARALVVHVAPAIDSVPAGGFGMSHGAVVHELTDADRAPLDLAQAMAAEQRVAVTTVLLRGPTVRELTAYADEHDVDLIVIGSRGHGALTTALLGSVSVGVLRHTLRPVLIVRGHAAKAVEATEPCVLA